jgi:hypothetical protein
MSRFLPILIITLAGADIAHAQESIVQTRGPVSLEIRKVGKTAAIALADLIEVELRVDGSAKLHVQPSKDVPRGWTLVRRLPVVTERPSDNRIRWRVTQWFAPQMPGKLTFELPPMQYDDGDEPVSVKFAPIDFTVTTQITNVDLAQLRDAVEIEALPPIEQHDHSHWWWTALPGAILLLAVLILTVRRLFRRVSQPSAAQLALREWQRLMALRLPEQGRSERFITLLTLLVRQYLERQYALPARRRTTPEFLNQLAQVATLAAEQKHFLASFLEQSEQVKFAQVSLTSDECLQWAQATRQFLDSHRNGL